MFKNINWGLVIVIAVVVIVGGVIAQMLVKEETGTDGKVKRSLSIGDSKKETKTA